MRVRRDPPAARDLGRLSLNTAITLPVGVEAYGAYALGAWLAPGAPEQARVVRPPVRGRGPGSSACSARSIYHLLAAAHATRAPWPVVVLVSCLPVVTLGFGAALTHLLRGGPASDLGAPVPERRDTPAADPGVTPEAALEAIPRPALEAVPDIPARPQERPPVTPAKQPGPATPERVAEFYAGDLAEGGCPPSGRSSVNGRSATTRPATCMTT